MLEMRFEIVLEKLASGNFQAACPNLPGCVAEGRSRREALLKVKRTILDFIGMSVDFTIRQILAPGPAAGTDLKLPLKMPDQIFYTQKMERMKLPFAEMAAGPEEIIQVGVPVCFN